MARFQITHPISADDRRRDGLTLPLIYALANAGGVIGYLPLFTLLLPLKVEGLAGDARVGVLATCAIAGAVTAALSNILFGWLSDRSLARGGGRRCWLAGGVVATAACYALIGRAHAPLAIIAAIVVFQIAINAVLAPLTALMADEIPDEQKGLATGLLAAGAPVASGVSLLLVETTSNAGSRFAAVPLAFALGILPLLLMKPRQAPTPWREAATAVAMRRDLTIAWAARLLMLVGSNLLSLYLLYYSESVTSASAADLPARVARLLIVAAVIPVPVAALLGRLSDRVGQRKPFLLGAAVIAAAGLVVMAATHRWTPAAIGFCIYTAGSATFAALHTGFAMQLLPSARHRGRDLGLLNLANTIPSLIGPLMTWWLVTARDFGLLMLVLAGISLVAGLLMLAVRTRA